MANIHEIVEDHRAALLKNERSAAMELIEHYKHVHEAIQPALKILENKIQKAKSSGEEVTPGWLFERDRVESLLYQTSHSVNSFSRSASTEITQEQQKSVIAAQENFVVQIKELGLPDVLTSTILPSEDTLNGIAGFMRDGSPLSNHLSKLTNVGIEAIKKATVQSVALGRTPEETSIAVRDASAIPLRQALTISRTEVFRAYREASRQIYLANEDIIKGWRWFASLSSHICPMCLAMNGILHKLTEEFGSHPNCRCIPFPEAKTFRELGIDVVTPAKTNIESGEAWLKQQTKAVQEQVLGKAGAAAWHTNDIKLSDFVGEGINDKWGRSRRVLPLAQARLIHDSRRGRIAFAPPDSGEDIPQRNESGQTTQTGNKAITSNWKKKIQKLLDERASFGEWGQLLPTDSTTDLFPSERTIRMRDHLMKIGAVVDGEVRRRLDADSVGQKQVNKDQLFLVDVRRKIVAQDRARLKRETQLAKERYGIARDLVAADSEREIEFFRMLEIDDEHVRIRNIHLDLVSRQSEVQERVNKVPERRRDMYLSVLREVRSMGLLPGQHASTIAGDLDNETADAIKESVQFYPSDWLQRSREFNELKIRIITSRGHYVVAENGKPSELNISGRRPKIEGDSLMLNVGVHEFGHRFEEVFPEIRVFEALFYRHRTAISATEQEEKIPLDPPEVVDTLKSFEPGRMRPDRFVKSYIGKDMGNEYHSLYEILTVGMEGIFTGSYNVVDDENMTHFIMGLLAGV